MPKQLPKDIVTEILLRLPVKSLLKFSCVSKSWKSLICNPTFISMYSKFLTSNNNHKNKNHMLVRRVAVEDENEHFVLHQGATGSKCQKLELSPLCKTQPEECFRIVGCCNGLLCLCYEPSDSREEMVLWNPSINKYRSLHSPTTHGFPYDRDMHLGLGFGCDASFNHKIIRIAYPSIKTHPGFPAKVGLYDLSKDNWRSIDDAGPRIPYFICDFSPQAFTHGAIHWIAFTCNDSIHGKLPNLIMLFDMENEVFTEMEVPDILGKEHEYNLSVGVYDDTICVMQYNQWSRDGWNNGSHCSIWVMKEYGEPKSWAKQFNIELGMHKVVCFRGNGEAVVALNDGKLASYDLNRKRISDLGITGNRFYFFASAYVESLFLLLTRE